MLRLRLALLLLLVLFAPRAEAVGLAWDGTLIGYVERPEMPCFGDSCYIPCQQAYDAADNQSVVSNACLQRCMLDNGGGGSAGGYPAAFMDACMSCASQDITAAVELGLYANCKAAKVLGGSLIDEIVDATGCGEEPETCETSAGNAGSAMQAVADALSSALGQPVEYLATPAAKEAAIRKARKAKVARDKGKGPKKK